MKSDAFYWVLNMSIFGGLLCGIVLLLRRWKALPRLLVYCLWSLPFLRLVCPFGLNGQVNLAWILERLGGKSVPAMEMLGAEQTVFTGVTCMNCIGAAQSYSPVVFPEDGKFLLIWSGTALQSVLEAAALVWAAVAAVLLLLVGIVYAVTLSEVRTARRGEDYWLSDRISCPAVYGILRQRIVLPCWADSDTIPYILLHEQVHLCRRDNLWRFAAVAVCCIHWFNPMCWISLKYFFQDMELACDAAVLRCLPDARHRAYAQALLTAAQSRELFSSAFGGAKLTARIENILTYKRLTALSAGAFFLLFLLLSYVLVTG